MNAETLEFVVIVVAALLIVGAVIEVFQLLTHHAEVKRARFLENTRQHRQDRHR